MFPSMISVVAAIAAAAGVAPGYYDGAQTEMGAGLELRADGRFRFGLTYGALDEHAEGRWVERDGKVLLSSDPVTPPKFELAGKQPGEIGQLEVRLDLPPGISPQYFHAVATFADGRREATQFDEEGRVAIGSAPASPPATVQIFLPLFGLANDPLPLSGERGYALSFRFLPNDLGTVDFREEPLAVEEGDLLLRRHERNIRFRRVADVPAD